MPAVGFTNCVWFKQYGWLKNPINNQYWGGTKSIAAAVGGGGKTAGRWLKERKKGTRAHNAQLHATVSVAALAAATAASSGHWKDDEVMKTDLAVASAASLS